jgi:predicted DNA-binding WGR domain protein
MIRYSISIVLLLLAFACSRPKIHTHEITRIELARSGAWSDRGGAMRIDSSLTYVYYGDFDNTNKKYYTSKISKDYWDSLTRNLESVNYQTVRDTEHFKSYDANEYELIVFWKNKKRRIIRDGSGNDTVLKVIEWINSSYKHLPLMPSKKTIKFETTYQNPPPIPQIDHVKFPPPSNSRKK